ncbi:hypothetical protein Enr13x_10260 [Stieleria neptunia]|uniref:Secreted protein n=1 Tax=Stieleria neptunia TaxID=2527979 RepID=A0A518HK07_9BACT|nr:hypothetical protein [Stieleria neptunia]QDV41188.1 hypothetical protein Enr13x_10260 [Stieleria neptunia]
MSISNRGGKSVAKLAAALCVLSTGVVPADGGELPKLIRTTSPIRVAPAPVEDGEGTFRFAELGETGATGITDTLPPARSAAPAPSIAAARSAAIVQRPPNPQTRSLSLDTGRGERLTNPLVVDAPPKLRRFRVQDYPLVMPTIDSQSSADAEVDRRHVLPPQPVADLDAAMDVLSAQTNPEPALLGTAIQSGFGSLAIDQIGSHLEQPSSPGHTMDYPPLGRFSTDLVLPPGQPLELHTPGMTSSFREQFGTIDAGSLIEDTSDLPDEAVPALPSPTGSPQAAAIARSLQVLGQGATQPASPAAMEVALNDRGDGEGRVALEVEELLAASSQQAEDSGSESKSNQDVGSTKPSLAEKFVGWSRRLTSGRTSSQNQSVSTRLSSERSSDDSSADTPSAGGPTPRQTTPQPRKRSGGILTQWLNRSR